MKNSFYIFILIFTIACSSTKKESDLTDSKLADTSKISLTIAQLYQFDSQLSQEGLSAEDNRNLSNLDIPGQIVASCLSGKTREGLELAKQTFKHFKNKAVFWNARGICEEISGNHLLSDIAWRKALKIDSKFSPAYVNLGIAMAKQDKADRALAFFKKAQEVGRFSALPLYNMAILYLENGLADRSLNILKGIVSDKNKNEGILGGIGVASLATGNVDDAVKYLSQLSSSKLTNPSWGLNYSFALYLKGDYSLAKKVSNATNWNENQLSKQYYQEIMFLLGKKI